MSLLNSLRRRVSDHPLRHIAQNALLHLPLATSLHEQRCRSHKTSGAMNEPLLMAEWAKWIIDSARLGGVGIEGATLIEVGPGHSLGVAASLLLAGAAKVFAVDVRRLADPSDIAPFELIVPELRRLGVIAPKQAVDLRQDATNLRYSIISRNGTWTAHDESIDLVYSFYSGEHLRAPEIVLSEAYRVLKSGGLCIQRIDLRDHYHLEGNWLKFLYYDRWLWELMHSKRGRWSNRILAPQWKQLFEHYFDELVLFDEKVRPLPADFDRSRLCTAFRDVDIDTLSVWNIWIVARKTLQPSLQIGGTDPGYSV